MPDNEEIYGSAKEKLEMIKNEEKWIVIKNLVIALLALAVGVVGILISSLAQANSLGLVILDVFYLFSFIGVFYSIINLRESREQAVKIVNSVLESDPGSKGGKKKEESAAVPS